jgi:hypothetical protein
MRIRHLITILVLLAGGLLPSPAHAGGVVTVCDEAHLLAALAGGGTVTFACSGVITLSNTITIAADATIDGTGHVVIISGNNAVRVFTVNAGATLNLSGLTIANGRADAGGGVSNSGTLTVSNSIFFGNSASGNGGGIFIPTCSVDCGDIAVIVNNSTFSGNSASGNGGGIFISPYCYENCGQMTLTVNNSAFSGNTANGAGGGIFHDGDYMTQVVAVIVSNSTFSNNAAGAIFSGNHTTLNVSNSTFSGNHGPGIATAIYSYATLRVSNSIFTGNSGHGIRNSKWNSLTVSNSAFSSNGGCGIDNYDASLTVSDSTFFGNAGCGVANGDDGGTATVTNCTFSNNGGDGGDFGNSFLSAATVSNSTFASTSAGHGGISNGVEATLTVVNSTLHGVPVINSEYDGTVTLKNTIVAHSLTGSNCTGEIIDGGGNLSYPDSTCPGIHADPLLGPLQDNGGPTWTMALGPGSAAMDAGDDATCAADPVNNRDQRGVVRPQGAHCDSGALEQLRKWLPVLVVTTSR